MADRERDIRSPQPNAAAEDPGDAARQEQVRRDAAAVRAEARRVEASMPPDLRDKTVGEIVEEANRRAQR